MFPLLALAAIGALVYWGTKKILDPARKDSAEEQRLHVLKAKSFLTLDEAENGLVLSRRFGDSDGVRRFAAEVKKLKPVRSKI